VTNKIILIRLLVLSLFAPIASLAADVDQVTAVGEKRVTEGKAAQAQVDKLGDQAGDIEGKYKQVIKVVDGLKVYNGLLQRQVDNQLSEMTELADSIDKVSLIERQIIPLMVRMLDSLEEFIRLDVPFLGSERAERLLRLRGMMERSDVTAAEKFRRILEAYDIENEYGRTIEAYKGSLDVAGKSREVDFLRVGRVALLYQTIGGDHTGAWDQANRTWETLPPEQYKQDVAKGLRIARKQVAPDLLVLPIAAATGEGQ
jgi:Protein of unknown function (DUF3450)